MYMKANDRDDPRALGELDDQKDQDHDRGDRRRERIHEDAEAPLAGSLAQVSRDHPAPASVNPVNTPIAYSATSAFTLALKTMIKVSATMPSTMMPLERRVDALVSSTDAAGIYRRNVVRENGKPLKDVLPPV